MVLVCLVHFSDLAILIFCLWKESGPELTIQPNHLSNVIDLATKNSSKFHHINGLVRQYYNLKIYLSMPTKMLPIAGLQYLSEYYMLVLFMTLNFYWIWDSKPDGGWTWISRTESSYVNHIATLRRLWLVKSCKSFIAQKYFIILHVSGEWERKAFTIKPKKFHSKIQWGLKFS